jgi:hypothetical protein
MPTTYTQGQKKKLCLLLWPKFGNNILYWLGITFLLLLLSRNSYWWCERKSLELVIWDYSITSQKLAGYFLCWGRFLSHTYMAVKFLPPNGVCVCCAIVRNGRKRLVMRIKPPHFTASNVLCRRRSQLKILLLNKDIFLCSVRPKKTN